MVVMNAGSVSFYPPLKRMRQRRNTLCDRMLGSMMSCLPNDHSRPHHYIIGAVTTTCTTLGHYQQHCGSKPWCSLSAAYAASKFAIQGYFVVVSDPICIDLQTGICRHRISRNNNNDDSERESESPTR
jgi:hypothetical protein